MLHCKKQNWCPGPFAALRCAVYATCINYCSPPASLVLRRRLHSNRAGCRPCLPSPQTPAASLLADIKVSRAKWGVKADCCIGFTWKSDFVSVAVCFGSRGVLEAGSRLCCLFFWHVTDINSNRSLYLALLFLHRIKNVRCLWSAPAFTQPHLSVHTFKYMSVRLIRMIRGRRNHHRVSESSRDKGSLAWNKLMRKTLFFLETIGFVYFGELVV